MTPTNEDRNKAIEAILEGSQRCCCDYHSITAVDALIALGWGPGGALVADREALIALNLATELHHGTDPDTGEPFTSVGVHTNEQAADILLASGVLRPVGEVQAEALEAFAEWVTSWEQSEGYFVKERDYAANQALVRAASLREGAEQGPDNPKTADSGSDHAE